MKNKLIVSILLLSTSLSAQQIQWANKVIKCSSDLGGKQFGIKHILGKPDTFPQAGSSPNAWTPKNALNGNETIQLGFEKPQDVKQIAVFENLNAGCVTRISVDTGDGKYQTVWSRKRDWKTPTFKTTIPTDRSYYFKRKRRKIQEAPDVINPGIEHAILDQMVGNVVAVKVEFNFSLLPGQKQIDAVGISDSEKPIEAKINSTETFEKLADAKISVLDGITPTNPVISLDGKQLFITNFSDDTSEIFSFTKDALGNWTNKKAAVDLNSADSYNYVYYVGSKFLLKGGSAYSRGTNETGYEIFSRNNGNYKAEKPIKIAAYTNYDDTSEATISNDGKIFIMAIETDFTQGGTDLYFAQQKEDGTYGYLQNMGKVINSANDEGMVQLLSDQKTILFSSNGFSSFGDFDIYVSYRLDETWKNWSEPINLGSKVNSNGFEGFPFYDEQDALLYYITNLQGTNVLKTIAIPVTLLLHNK